MSPEFKGAFSGCPWCYGRGCNQCSIEREKFTKLNFDEDGLPKPIATFTTDDPADMELAKGAIGMDALQKAFSPGGGGVREIEYNCAVASLIQVLRREHGSGQLLGSAEDGEMTAN